MSRRRKRPAGLEASAIVFDELTAAMPEAALQANAEGLLRFYGWRFLHVPDNKPRKTAGGRVVKARITRGFPDLLGVRRLAGYGPELLIAELKAEAGRYGEGQREWLSDFDAIAAAVMALASRLEELDPGAMANGGGAPAIGVYTWRPSDLASGAIERVLAGPEGVGVPVSN